MILFTCPKRCAQVHEKAIADLNVVYSVESIYDPLKLIAHLSPVSPLASKYNLLVADMRVFEVDSSQMEEHYAMGTRRILGSKYQSILLAGPSTWSLKYFKEKQWPGHISVFDMPYTSDDLVQKVISVLEKNITKG